MPPPDDPAFIAASKPATTRAWFPAQHVTSYQSGGVPTFNTSQAGGLGAVEAAEVESGVNSWETAYGMRVEVLAAFAYLLGPISGKYCTFHSTHSSTAETTHSPPQLWYYSFSKHTTTTFVSMVR